MASRPHGASQINISRELLKSIDNKFKKCVLVARDPEQLVYAFIDLFYHIKETKRNDYSFVFPRYIKKLFALMHTSFIKRDANNYDQILFGQYGKSMSAWGESRWLYWVNDDSDLNICSDMGKIIYFSTSDKLKLFPSFANIPYASIGPKDKFERYDLLGEEILLDTSPWTMHSSSDTIIEFVNSLSSINEIILFHDFTKRLDRFVKKNNIQCTYVKSSICTFE